MEPVLPSTVGGVAAAVTQFGRTEASVLIEEAETEISYGWRLDTGSCQGSGTILGGAALYPPLIPNQGGTASANAVLPVLLRARSTYSVRILQSGGGGQLVVACGDLVLKE